jgi:hypothetical protein
MPQELEIQADLAVVDLVATVQHRDKVLEVLVQTDKEMLEALDSHTQAAEVAAPVVLAQAQ